MKSLLDGLHGILRSLIAFAVRRPRACLGLFAAFLIFAWSGLARLKVSTSIRSMADASYPSYSPTVELEDKFETGTPATLLIRAKPGSALTHSQGCRVFRWYGERLTDPEQNFSGALSSFEPRRWAREENGRIWFPRILENPCDPTKATQPYSVEPLRASGWGPLMATKRSDALLFSFDFAAPLDHDRVGSLFESARAMAGDDLETLGAGPAFQEWQLKLGIRANSRLNVIACLLTILLLRFFFGTWRSGLIFITTLAASGLSIYGLMGWAGHSVDALSSGLFLMMAVATIEDFIFASERQLEHPGSTPTFSLRRTLLPGFLTSLTTLIGFWSLLKSDIRMVANFGLWAGAGALLEWLILFLALPAFFRCFPRFGASWINPRKAWKAVWIAKLERSKFPPWLAWPLSILVCVPFLFWDRLEVSDHPLRLFPKENAYRVQAEDLLSELSFQTDFSVLFPPTVQDARRSELSKQICDFPLVAFCEDRAWMSEEFLGPAGELREMGERLLENGRWLSRYEAADGTHRLVVYASTLESKKLAALFGRIRSLCGDECATAGPMALYTDFSQLVPPVMLDPFWEILCVLGLTLWLARARGLNGRQLAAVLLSTVWGVAVPFGAFLVFQIPVNVLTCVFASSLVGLCGDNAIHFLLHGRRGQSMTTEDLLASSATLGRPTILVGLSMSIVSLVFLGSVFHPPKIFGAVLALGFLANIFGDYWIFRALLPKGNPR